MLYYYNEKMDPQKKTYSCDMVRLTFEFPQDEEKKNHLMQYFCASGRLDIDVYPVTTKEFKYRNLVVINYGTSTATYGFGYNGCHAEDRSRCFLEFNPNKIMNGNQEQFRKDLEKLQMYCNSWECARYDLAIDIPEYRENVYMENSTGKLYKLERYSNENKTEWLGRRNAPGYVKLYNKANECENVSADGEKVDKLTRLEMTCDFNSSAHTVAVNLPNTYILASYNDDTGELDDSDKVLVKLLRSSPDKLSLLADMGRRKRKKIEPYIIGGGARLQFDEICIEHVHETVKQFLGNTSIAQKLKENKRKDEWIDASSAVLPFDE